MPRKSRNTKQKEILVSELEKMRYFFSAEELHKKSKAKDNNIGIATVYRFLKELKRKSRIYSYICDRKTIYSKADKSHCHYVCEKTGKVSHFEIKSLDFLKGKIPGSITSFQLEIKGVCNDAHDHKEQM